MNGQVAIPIKVRLLYREIQSVEMQNKCSNSYKGKIVIDVEYDIYVSPNS